jgi:protein-L-isoaspartate(D-aspartate) O-methyltransferase
MGRYRYPEPGFMSGERAKRFPLALADLQRQPQAKAGEGAQRLGSSAATLASAARSAPANGTAKPKPAGQARAPAKAAGSAATAKTGAPPHKSASAATHHVAGKPVTPRAVAHGAGKTAANLAAAAGKSAVPRTPHRSAAAPAGLGAPRTATGRQGAPQVALSHISGGALALTSERVRERMVERLRANGLRDPRVLGALALVPRHLFVDPGLAAQAYEDAALPIGHQQTISKPSVVARMIELVAANRTLNRVLEIGTGCGYQAAVLSRVANEVYSIERIKPLYERAKLNLRPLRVPNIRLHYGDGRIGLPEAAPFDAIVIAAAGLDVPPALLEQLAVGGRLIAPVGAATGDTQVLTLVERTGQDQWRETRLDRVFFVPLKSGVI